MAHRLLPAGFFVAGERMVLMIFSRYLLLTGSCLAGLLASTLQAQEEFKIKDHYVKSEQMIPMRDGVKLFTIIYKPKQHDRKQMARLGKRDMQGKRGMLSADAAY